MKDPAFLFYSSDFLTGTMLLNDEQVGKYIRLLCLQHQIGRLTEQDMLNICRTYDKRIFDKFKKDDDNNYYNERLEMEINKRKNFCQSRRDNRLSGIKSKSKQIKKKQNNICQSYVQHMENENINENININIDNKDVPDINFDEDIFAITKIKIKKDIITAVLKPDYCNYLRMRNSINKPFKSSAALIANFNLLRKLSGGTVDVAINILNQSIGNQWQGLFSLKQN